MPQQLTTMPLTNTQHDREPDNFVGGDAGFIGLNPSKTDILVVIPGTHGLKEWMEDFAIVQHDIKSRNANSSFTSAPAGARIHDGFHLLFNGIYQQVRQGVSTLVKSGKYSKVRFVGYSLGGPVAT